MVLFRSAALAALALTSAVPLAAKAPAPAPFDKGVVSAADPRAAEAGAEILRQGGNATDAALAVLLALTVVEPQSSGIGGGGFLVLDDGKGRLLTLDGREKAPKAATPDWFKVEDKYLSVAEAIPGGKSVGVPGNVSMMAEAHRRHGRLKWRQIFQPAIRLAGDGFVVSERLNAFLERFSKTAALSEEGRALYYPGGKPVAAGTVLRNPRLAAFLERLSREGAKAFYSGQNAAAIVDAVNNAPRNRSAMTLADMASYRVKARPPVCANYRKYRLCGMGPPSSGATTVFGALGVLEKFDLPAMGKDSPTAWHLIVEAQRLAYADRERYLADPDFVDVPVAGLLAPDYLAARAQLVATDRTMPSVAPGNPAGVKVAMADGPRQTENGTSHFAVIDRNGMAASLTSTIESAFGSGLMVNGYFLNNELTDLSIVPEVNGKPVANRVESGKRPRSSMAPTIVYGPDGKVKLAVGAAGGVTIPAQVLKAIIAVIDWNLPVDQALGLPVIFAPGGNTVFVEGGTEHEQLIPVLNGLGHPDVRLRERSFKANAVEVRGGKLVGAADPRSEGEAARQ
ncbi:gamma-glutamyltransferase [Novosphingobium sp. APW14]|uniref:gamma-glutamyltransferase n=1 Tax=Novosphingobium sp. APW14 TaxID=3077237 RepID=UPI0028DE1353|nr:gamma-glutamyltransferase [Novosphingobium sp. APW14]MDT9013546.1 gamma-glutamyltransferase [Novosphingobium sp. APW14]